MGLLFDKPTPGNCPQTNADQERVLGALDGIHFTLTHFGANHAASVPFLVRRVDPEEFQDEDCFESCDDVGPFLPRLADSLESIATILNMICANHAASMPDVGCAVDPEVFWHEESVDVAEADSQDGIAAGEEETCRVCGGIDTHNCPGGFTWAEPGLCSSCAEKQAAS
jgi:hypothetical protein